MKILKITMILLALVTIINCSGVGTSNRSGLKKVNTETTTSVKPTKTPKPIPSYEFKSGKYISGEDFQPGIYDIVAIKGNGNVSAGDIWNDGIIEMMGVDDNEIYTKEYKNIELIEGSKLKITGVIIKLIRK